jgi:hypothetical protein
MCFPRNPGLGRYIASRKDWLEAYRNARVRHRAGLEPDHKNSGIKWKAELIVAYHRNDHCDPLNCSLAGRMMGLKVIQEILAEKRGLA